MPAHDNSAYVIQLETVAAFIWNAYKRPNYPGWPTWEDAPDVQKRACENDAHSILQALEALNAR